VLISNRTTAARGWLIDWRRRGGLVIDSLLPDAEHVGRRVADAAGWRPDPVDEYCGRCGATVAPEAVTETGCPHCRGQRLAWDGAWRLGAYEPPLGLWVRRMKFGGMWRWGEWFGDRLAEAVIPGPPKTPNVVIPVPLHWTRRVRRGFDQAAMIAERLARARGWPVAPLLRRTRRTQPQSLIRSKAGRSENVRGAFEMQPVDLAGWTVWLVDDVKTSGATMSQCARLVRHAGAERVEVAVAAVAGPRARPSGIA